MEPISFLPAPGAPTDSEEQDLAEIDAAIELVRSGLAARVRLVGIADAGDGRRAPASPVPRRSDVEFSVDRGARAARSR